MSDSNSHSPLDVPFLMAGSGPEPSPATAPRRAKGHALANVMLTIAQKYGAEMDRSG